MRRITTLLLITALLTGASALSPLPVSAQEPPAQDEDTSDTERFRELGSTGAEAFARKDYEAAVEAFRAAYAIKPVPNLLYNIGRALEKQGDFEGAIAQYEEFVNEPDVELKARQDALQRLKTLREVLALREDADEGDAEAVDPSAISERQGERELADPTEETPSDDEQAQPAEAERDYTLAYVFGATGAATLIGSGVFAGLAATQKSDFDDAATLAGRRSAAETGNTYTTVADSMLVAGVVFAAAGVYFWAEAPEETPAEGARLVPSVGPDGASVTFSLDF
jgi:tetratricopeptide (TPR) repeat protein